MPVLSRFDKSSLEFVVTEGNYNHCLMVSVADEAIHRNEPPDYLFEQKAFSVYFKNHLHTCVSKVFGNLSDLPKIVYQLYKLSVKQRQHMPRVPFFPAISFAVIELTAVT